MLMDENPIVHPYGIACDASGGIGSLVRDRLRQHQWLSADELRGGTGHQAALPRTPRPARVDRRKGPDGRAPQLASCGNQGSPDAASDCMAFGRRRPYSAVGTKSTA